jgi:dTDP-4-amino-4,6-dideoxygalactose transaminase
VPKKRINVTRAVRPSLLRTIYHFRKVIISRWYSNDGVYLKKFEKELNSRFNLKNTIIMTNGTLPLLALMNQYQPGLIATTPFSFVATTSSILMAGHEPVFVDVDATTLQVRIDELEKILKKGSIRAMLFTHVYGRPENVIELEHLSLKYKVDLFFDASHCVGVSYLGKSIFEYGKASTLSMHATKILSSGEGGAIFTKDDELANQLRAWRNFGIDQGEIVLAGVNAKMSEFSAVLGLESLRTYEREIHRRKLIVDKYHEKLADRVTIIDSPNHSYFPILLKDQESTLRVVKTLTDENIFPRRYFFPSLNKLPFIRNKVECLNSEDIASRVLCLPIGDDVTNQIAGKISSLILRAID